MNAHASAGFKSVKGHPVAMATCTFGVKDVPPLQDKSPEMPCSAAALFKPALPRMVTFCTYGPPSTLSSPEVDTRSGFDNRIRLERQRQPENDCRLLKLVPSTRRVPI